ncbi:MAG TPA: AI-2E family transporter [Terriglobia bacterium]|nr:AI-2E family transporter [Terriglobia bacterium]
MSEIKLQSLEPPEQTERLEQPEQQDRPFLPITSSKSLRIIAAAIVFICAYYASSILITLIVSILIAFVLDPAVSLLERIRIPRWLGAAMMVMFALGLLYLLSYLVYDRAAAFVEDLPNLTGRIKQIVEHYQGIISHLRQSTTSIISSPENNFPTVQLQQQSGWTAFLLRGIGSVYTFAVTVMFIPFLVFFMLTSKRHVRSATVFLFPDEHHGQVERILDSIGSMVREYVFGNILVALVSMAIIAPVYVLIHLRYALILAGISAVLDLVPYIGVALAALPPLLVALMQFDNAAPIIIIAVAVSVVHFISVNMLTPKLVGSRVRLNALSVTLAMMLWGWLWGAMGLVLAVPITAAFKAVCDNVPSLKALGHWLGEGE